MLQHNPTKIVLNDYDNHFNLTFSLSIDLYLKNFFMNLMYFSAVQVLDNAFGKII